MAIVLPPLEWRQSPNRSSRRGTKVRLLVWHETAGSYAGAIAWLCTPTKYNPDGSVRSGPDASAHLVIREDGREATQLVRLSEKAWHAAAFNPESIGIEHANITPKGYATEAQLEVSARVFAWLCHRYSVPPRWSRDGSSPGIARHADLGRLGGGHTQCGPELPAWHRFLELVHAELARGGFRPDWAKI